MENKKKSFYFEDYTEAELTEKSKSNVIRVVLNRVTFLSFVFFSLMLIFSIKIIYLSLSAEKNFYNKNISKSSVIKRKNIVDRNGAVLATNVTLYDVGVIPKLLKKEEKKTLLIKLNLLFPELDLNEIKLKLNKEDFFSIGKRLTPKEKDQFWLMGNKAFVFDPKPSRI